VNAKTSIKEDEKVKRAEKFKVEDKIKVEGKVEAEDKAKLEENISINIFVEEVIELVIMLKIIEVLLKKFQIFKNTSQSLLMYKKMIAQNFYSLHL